ncbi:MAG: hypothetical protein GY832_22170 [Chloroflexi bacterium]|nr:hypothetical protein [Chloroflexota bacterium]
MKQLRFEGRSDDTFGEMAVFYDDYDNCAADTPIVYRVWTDDDELFVVGQYGQKGTPGCWCIGVQALEEKVLANWPMRLENSKVVAYSPALIIDAPDGVQIECVGRARVAKDEIMEFVRDNHSEMVDKIVFK